MHLENLLLSNDLLSLAFTEPQQSSPSSLTSSTPSSYQPTPTTSETFFNFELTEEQQSLERQFTSAFFDTIRLNDDEILGCDFEEPIEPPEEELSLSELIDESINFDVFDVFEDEEPTTKLPSFGSHFNSFIRTSSEGNIDFDTINRVNPMGHLLGTPSENNNSDFVGSYENQIVLPQSEALGDNQVGEMQCKWVDCYQRFWGEAPLVKHIEKMHIEVKRGEEFACFWENCPRKTKPFNARYKLLIHMRVHSGEKPNKCPWPYCNKAFSRLENLKIHQRSHTGERPYKCQHQGCHKAFSNSSDRAKHQRTHVDTKPYACQVVNCTKRYTDPSSLRKHVKNHSVKEQAIVKSKRPKVTAPPTETSFVTDESTRQIKMDLKNKIMEKKLQDEFIPYDSIQFEYIYQE